jgi:CDP-diglyceride synthetase
MSDKDTGDADSESRDLDDGVDESPLLSFDSDSAQMPHWAEPASGDLPGDGDRVPPSETSQASSALGRSRLFPDLPDDDRLVDTSDTSFFDAARSDTLPTMSPIRQDSEEQSELVDLLDTSLIELGDLAIPDQKILEGKLDTISETDSLSDEYFDQTLFADQNENVFGDAVLEDTGILVAREIENLDARTTDASDLAVSKSLIENDEAGSVENRTAKIFGGDVEALPYGDDEHETARSDRDDEERTESEVSSVKDSDKPQTSQGLVDPEDKPLETHNQAPKAPLRNRLVSTFGSNKKERIVDSESDGPKTDLPDDEVGEKESDLIDEWVDSEDSSPHWRENNDDYGQPRSIRNDERTLVHGDLNQNVAGSESSGRSGRNIPVAIAVGAGLAGVFFGLLKIGPAALMVFVVSALILAAAEFYKSVRSLGYRPATLIGLTAVAGLSIGAYTRGAETYPVVLGLVIVVGLCWFVFGFGGEHATANLAVTILGIMWVGVLGSFAALILSRPHGDAVLIGAVLGTAAYDIGGYVIGSTTGQSKLAPHLSPNKTYEGLLGGMLLAVIVSILVLNNFPGVFPWTESMLDPLFLGISIAVMAPLGDLAQSMVKRDLGVKDMGSLLPGHGGIFDRFDALLFVLPTSYYVAELVLY